MQAKVKNARGIALDVLASDEPGEATLLLAHGFGTSKHENYALFDDIDREVRGSARIVRFDFSGYGQSGGQQEDVSLATMADDVRAMVAWSKAEFSGRLMILGHSMGGFAIAAASPDGVERSIFSGIPRPNTDESVEYLQQRLLKRGGLLNVDGVSIYPRKDGSVQKLGPQFWSTYRDFDPLGAIGEYAQKTELTIIKPLEDEIIGGREITNPYTKLPGVTVLELHGDHNFTKKNDRKKFLRKVHEIIAERG